MSTSESREFSRFQRYLWPIHRHELKKLIPMLGMFFLISFSYNVLRTMKDSLIVHAPGSGAEAIPFIKVWMMLPGAFFMVYLYSKLSNIFSRESVFYLMTSLFLAFFFFFTFVLYPLGDKIHLHGLADYLHVHLPEGCKGLVAMVRYWSFTSFYAMSELWGNIILFVLFWGFANHVTHLHEAKRFYGLFGIGANLSGILAGQVSIYCCRHTFEAYFPFGDDPWGKSMGVLIALVILSGVSAMGLFRFLNRHVLSDPRHKILPKEKKVRRISMVIHSGRCNFFFIDMILN